MKATLTLIFFFLFASLCVENAAKRKALNMANLSNEAHAKCLENELLARQQVRNWRNLALENMINED